MIPFKKYRYIYPPRPESKVRHTELLKYDNNTFLGQPKLNGSNCEVYTNGVDVYIMNRHKGELTNVKIGKSVFTKLHRGEGWMVLNGEYMNKTKKKDDRDQSQKQGPTQSFLKLGVNEKNDTIVKNMIIS
jgi:hypothetical protein